MKAFDGINADWGDGAIKIAGEGTANPWKMRQAMRSKRFTTHWDELATVR